MHTFGTSDWVVVRDGRRLHTQRDGVGPVAVVFESGLGSSRSTWRNACSPRSRAS